MRRPPHHRQAFRERLHELGEPGSRFARAAIAQAGRPAAPGVPGGRRTGTACPAPRPPTDRGHDAGGLHVPAHVDARQAAARWQTESSTVARSSSRSTMTVANVAVAFMPSCRASRYGRSTSPTRAGSRNVAVNPMTVVRNAVRKRACPIGRRSACHRQARSTYVCSVTSTAAAMYPGWACVIARQVCFTSTLRKNSHSNPAVRATITSVCHGMRVLRDVAIGRSSTDRRGRRRRAAHKVLL